MSRRGIVSFLVDPDPAKRFVVSDEWCRWLLDLGKPGEPLSLRCPVYAAPDNSFPTALYKQSLDTHRAHGFAHIVGEVAAEFDRVQLNSPLGLGGEPTLNAGIQAYTLRMAGVVRQLAPHGLADWWVWNEPNISSQIKPTDIPGTGRIKPTALAPEVFASLLYQGAKRAKAYGATRVYAGALTCLEQFHTNPAGDWVAGYLDKGLSYLAAHRRRDLAVDVVGLNMEGWVDAPYAHRACDAVRAVFAKHGYAVEVAIGEWGWPNGTGVDETRAMATFLALDGAADETYHFQFPLRDPGDVRGYGAVRFDVTSGRFVAVEPMAWFPVLQKLFRL